MKKNILLGLLVIMITFLLAGCGGKAVEEDQYPIPGTVTFLNLPGEYRISGCYVSNNPTPKWQTSSEGIEPVDESFYRNAIGYGPYSNTIQVDTINTANRVAIIGNESFDFIYSGRGSVYVRFHTSDTYDYIWASYGYNNVHFSGGHATVNYLDMATAFSLPETEGEFTLTGAGEFNGKYAILYGAITGGQTIALYGFGNATSATTLKGYKISGGNVVIPVYQINVDAGDTNFNSYSGNHTITALILIILDTEEFDALHYAANSTSYKYLAYTNAAFSGGKMTKTVSEGTKIGF